MFSITLWLLTILISYLFYRSAIKMDYKYNYGSGVSGLKQPDIAITMVIATVIPFVNIVFALILWLTSISRKLSRTKKDGIHKFINKIFLLKGMEKYYN